VASLSGARGLDRAWIAVGPTGVDLSLDDGKTWQQMSSLGFDTVSVTRAADGSPVVFGAGANGRIGRLPLRPAGR
jgi:hypothetical protein